MNDSRRPPTGRLSNAHDDGLHSAHPPRTSIHAHSHHARRHQALLVQVTLRLPAHRRKGQPTQAEGRPAGCGRRCSVTRDMQTPWAIDRITPSALKMRRDDVRSAKRSRPPQLRMRGKSIKVIELWKPHVGGTMPLLEDLGHK
jgi:hypothetical protein